MADENSPPSIDPADEGSLAGVLRAVLGKFLQSVDDMLPAVVIAYDRARNRATVQPLIMMGATDGSKVRRAQIAEVPVLNMGGGGFVLSFPITAGDLGWIKASDRDLSLFLQGLREEWPNTTRAHSFQDGLFIPDVMRAWTLDAEDAERVVLQAVDGSARIAIEPGSIHLTAATLVKVDAPDAHFTGDVQVDGTVTATVDVVGGAKSLKSHKHTGVTVGAGITGAPQ